MREIKSLRTKKGEIQRECIDVTKSDQPWNDLGCTSRFMNNKNVNELFNTSIIAGNTPANNWLLWDIKFEKYYQFSIFT